MTQTSFNAQVFQNPFLPEGATQVNAIITVASKGAAVAAAAAQPLCVGMMLDNSGSMGQEGGVKIRDGRNALVQAIALLRGEDYFFIIAGNSKAEIIVDLCQATDANKARATAQVRGIAADGGTNISTWLEAARRLFGKMPNAIRQAILLTDGENEAGDPLEQAIQPCQGVFQCECRGVGASFRPDQLRLVASKLLGTVDAIRKPADIAADFGAIIEKSKGLAVNDVSVQVWVPQNPQTRQPAKIVSFKQMTPEVLDLTVQVKPGANAQTFRFPTGAWGAEDSHDYHLVIELPNAGTVGGAKMLAARTAVIYSVNKVETKTGEGMVFAAWTDDVDQSSRIDPKVANYTGQAELVAQMQAGLKARRDGNEEEATKALQRAHDLAEETGNEGTKKLLQKVLDVDDKGTVKLKRHVDEADAIEAESRSARTKKLGA